MHTSACAIEFFKMGLEMGDLELAIAVISTPLDNAFSSMSFPIFPWPISAIFIYSTKDVSAQMTSHRAFSF